ncbi:MAG: Bug family tripartite tricarboxylate transporter substrate binding protein [Burkholderiales bacterium]
MHQSRSVAFSTVTGGLASGMAIFSMILIAGSAGAQYPVKPIRLMSPFPPGGGTDIVARQTAQSLAVRLGQPVVIESQAGAGGLIATQTVARAVPDGYTILFGVPSTITIAENFTKNPDYNPARDLAPIATVASYFTLFLVNPKVPASTLPEFITLAKANPKKFFYGTSGNGHAFHMLTELVSRQAGIEMVAVPYKGNGPAQTATIAGEVQVLVAASGAVRSQVQAGRMRVLATLQSTRLESFPDVPTLAEAGLSNLNIVNWFAVFSPIKVPREIQTRLELELLAMQKYPGFTQKVKELDFGPVGIGSKEFVTLLEGERKRWRDIIQAAGIKADLD